MGFKDDFGVNFWLPYTNQDELRNEDGTFAKDENGNNIYVTGAWKKQRSKYFHHLKEKIGTFLIYFKL